MGTPSTAMVVLGREVEEVGMIAVVAVEVAGCTAGVVVEAVARMSKVGVKAEEGVFVVLKEEERD